MTTREIAAQLAAATARVPFLGKITEPDFLEVVAMELGHEEILDDFQKYGGHFSRALAPLVILHVISGNTPHAGLQSLLRGLLLGSHNLCKIPGEGLREFQDFCAALPDSLAARVEISDTLPPDWISRANAVVVFGDDETVAHFRALVSPQQRFVGHGHKVSLAVIFSDRDFASAPLVARDVSLFDQQGCLSPHVIYVAQEPEKYAATLAREMELFDLQSPRAVLSPAEAAQIAETRDRVRLQAANGKPVQIYASENSTNWTVIFERDETFVASCLNRVVHVKPLPRNLTATLAPVREHLSAAAIWPATPEFASRLVGTGITRICPVGAMQSPPFTWHQDGGQNLASLVSWIDFEATR
jgi:hypothetical protein